MDDGNVDTWHNRTYESCTLVVKRLFNVQFIFNNPNLVAHYNYNVIPQKVKRILLRTATHTKTGNNTRSFGTRTNNTTTHTKLKITLEVEASELKPITQQLTQN